jgi:hypothetical protein
MDNLEPLDSQENYVEFELRVNVLRRLYWLYINMYLPSGNPNTDRITQLTLVLTSSILKNQSFSLGQNK